MFKVFKNVCIKKTNRFIKICIKIINFNKNKTIDYKLTKFVYKRSKKMYILASEMAVIICIKIILKFI